LLGFNRYSYGVEVVDDGPLTVGSFKADNGDVISHLNITQARDKSHKTFWHVTDALGIDYDKHFPILV